MTCACCLTWCMGSFSNTCTCINLSRHSTESNKCFDRYERPRCFQERQPGGATPHDGRDDSRNAIRTMTTCTLLADELNKGLRILEAVMWPYGTKTVGVSVLFECGIAAARNHGN